MGFASFFANSAAASGPASCAAAGTHAAAISPAKAALLKRFTFIVSSNYGPRRVGTNHLACTQAYRLAIFRRGRFGRAAARGLHYRIVHGHSCRRMSGMDPGLTGPAFGGAIL